jgi:Rhodopirellula transposase DDE domain
MDLTEPIKQYLNQTAKTLRGADRRLFLARTVRLLGPNGQRKAEGELGWNRGTIRKGLHELDSSIRCIDNFSARGRKRAEEHLPDLLGDVRALIDAQSQTDPTFHTQRLYTRLSAPEVRRQLISAKGYADTQLPCAETIRQKMLQLGYRLRKVAKSKPKKSCPRPTPSSTDSSR